MAIVRSSAGVLVINDTYNANPASMAAGIRTLDQVTQGRRVAVLGDMFELGHAAEQAHVELGQLVGEESVDFLLTVGSYGDSVRQGAVDAGMEVDKITVCRSKEEAVVNLRKMVKSKVLGDNDALLVKASRAMSFETIVQGFLESDGSEEVGPR